jgi:hypothetical protein
MTPFSDSPAGSVVQSCPLRENPKPVHWIEIQLIGEDNKPIPWMEYKIELASGDVATGYLDEHGLARVDGIEQTGICKVSFPDLDKDAWEPVGTSSS